MAVAEVDYLNGGGTPQPIDYSFLPSSNKANVLASSDYTKLLNEGNINLLCTSTSSAKAYVDLSAANTDVTAYMYGKALNIPSADALFFSVASALTGGNAPAFFIRSNVPYMTVWANDVALTGTSTTDYHLYALSCNQTSKKIRFYVDGTYKGELPFSNSGAQVVYGRSLVSNNGDVGLNYEIDYIGCVAECESDATIIANMQAIMSKMS